MEVELPPYVPLPTRHDEWQFLFLIKVACRQREMDLTFCIRLNGVLAVVGQLIGDFPTGLTLPTAIMYSVSTTCR